MAKSLHSSLIPKLKPTDLLAVSLEAVKEWETCLDNWPSERVEYSFLGADIHCNTLSATPFISDCLFIIITQYQPEIKIKLILTIFPN